MWLISQDKNNITKATNVFVKKVEYDGMTRYAIFNSHTQLAIYNKYRTAKKVLEEVKQAIFKYELYKIKPFISSYDYETEVKLFTIFELPEDKEEKNVN